MQTVWLTQTKFIPPQLRDDFIPRGRLLEVLEAAINSHALFLLSAPAGYGKTTLLASLSNKPITWISLDEEDNDLARFCLALVIALQKLEPGFGETVKSLLASLENPGKESHRILGAWINEILEKIPEVWLVLDDLHVITEPSVYLALDYLLEHIPAQLHLIVATRHDPPLSLARLRARGQLAELRVPDLRFTIDETRLFLNDKQCLNLSSEELAKLQTRAEGWAAGLRLLAGSLDQIASADDRADFIRDLTRTDRYVFDFLAEEVLKRQDAETRTFLLNTSILPELTGSLCNALTDRKDSQIVLDDLYRRNLFLTKAGETGTSFRYHALFADFLCTQLKREYPERFVELHRRAAEVQKATAPARAIAHHLAAELWEDAAQISEQVGDEFIRQGFLNTLNGWIDALPESVREAHPRILYLSGFCALQRGELDHARILLESAQRGMQEHGDRPGEGEVLLALIDTVNRQHDYAYQASLVPQALALPLPVHGQVWLLVSHVWESLYQKHYKEADAALDQALELMQASYDPRTLNVIAPILNMQVAFLPGGISRLERYCREVLERFGKQVGPIQAGTRSLYSCLLFFRGSLEEAAREVELSLAVSEQVGGLAYTDGQTVYVQGRLAEARGDYAWTESLWTEWIPKIAQASSTLPFVAAAYYFLGRAQWLQGKFDAARQAEARISAIVDPGEFPDTMMARKLMHALIEITDEKFDAAEHALYDAILLEQEYSHAAIFGSARAMLAYVHLRRKHEKEAWAQFEPFVAECETRNMAGLILQETKIVIPLLKLAVERKSHMNFALRLLDQLSASASPRPAPVPETGQTLTVRELEVLRLIVDAASNAVIAKRLVISEHTVKVHITNLFAKLNVSFTYAGDWTGSSIASRLRP